MKKYLQKAIVFCSIAIFCFGCTKDDVNNLLGNDSDKIVSGLKNALEVGVTNSVANLSAENGYLGDTAVKISLPQEVQTTFEVMNVISSNPACKAIFNSLEIPTDFENTLTTLVNRAAEDAAPKSAAIFKTAITNITIADGEGILFGADNAATEYLSEKTYTSLQAAFEPSVTASLETVKVLDYTPKSAWTLFAEQNNKLSNLLQAQSTRTAISFLVTTSVLSKENEAKIFSVKPVETDLSNYVTGEALNGLFSKVAGEEYKIRKDATARITPLLQDIFGRLDVK